MPKRKQPRTPTIVVNINNNEDFDIYIGRFTNNPKVGYNLGYWGNPFIEGKDGTREEVIEKYRQYIIKQPALLRRLPDLKGKRLGCWCAPLPCHGDVLKELCDSI